jgi:hypothetical protein
MKIPVFKPLWNLSGKIAYWLVDKSRSFWKKVGLSVSALAMSVLSVFCGMNPSLFGGLFSLHTAFAASTPNVSLAQYAGNIQVKASSLNNYFNSIESFNMDVTPLIGGYFIDNDLLGSAITDSSGYNVPFMPPSGNESSAWYFFQPVLMQGRTYNYTLYTGSEDLNGDIVYFPSSSGMTVNASNTLDFGANDFSININGFFDPNNTGADNIIFQNDDFALRYSNGQLVLSNGSGGIIQTQVSTLGSYTLKNGTYSTVLNNTSNAIVTMVVNPTSLVTSTSNGTTVSTTSNNTSTQSYTTYTEGMVGTKTYQYITQYTTYVTNRTTYNTTNITANTMTIDGRIPIIFGNYTTTVSGNGVTTLILNEQSSSAKTLSAGAVSSSSVSQTTYANTTNNTTANPVSSVISTKQQLGPTQSLTRITTYLTNNTTFFTSKVIGNITNINNAGQVGDRIGLMYYDIPSNTYAANWEGGDKILTVSRSGSILTVSDGSTTIMSIPLASDPVATDGTSSWTIAQQGAMKYLRSMTINNNGTDVASWNWEKGNTFTDNTGTGNTAYPSFITSPITNGADTTLSGYRAIDNYTTTTTSTTSATTTTQGGIIDTDTPDSDINREIDESKWENIFLFGIFYNLALDGGIPPSLIFIPLFGALAIIAFAIAYHFTRDILVSGLAGNAALGLGISMSVLYTIPLILGLIVMLVLLVKRKTVSL